MEAILKVIRKNALSKHHKLSENISESREVIKQGVSFRLKYLGSTLVEELEDDSQSYGNGMGALAVKTTVSMAKASGKKLSEVILHISDKGIHVRNAQNNLSDIMMTVSIYRINFCTADKAHEKVFAFIARNTDNETMECHAFLCSSHKMAENVALTVAQSFTVAKEQEENAGTSSRELGFRGTVAVSAHSDSEDDYDDDLRSGNGSSENSRVTVQASIASNSSSHTYRSLVDRY